MKLMVRAHDLGVKGADNINNRLLELGLDGVQFVAYKSIEGVSYAPNQMTREMAADISNKIKANGKDIALIGAYFNPVHPNTAKIDNGIAVFRDYISLARTIGCDYVGSETGSYNGDPWIYHPMNHSDEALYRVVDTFSSLADFAAENGVNIAIEGAFGHVCHTPERLKLAFDRMGKDNVKFIFDLYNYLDISNVDSAYDILERGLNLLGDRILLFHIKDFVIENNKLKQCGVGRGILDYDRILSAIFGHNPNAILVLEGTVLDDLPFAISYLKDKINKFETDRRVVK
ncbi:MAG: sugar phosphate isomerase/epimerase [Clostridia bacterium]|nr:sugar phosphate isomerase/epimerase [Clostridia bacterium]